MFEKFQTGEKIHDGQKKNSITASKLQPSDLCSNAYRSLPGNQDIFSLLFSCIYFPVFISTGALESDLS